MRIRLLAALLSLPLPFAPAVAATCDRDADHYLLVGEADAAVANGDLAGAEWRLECVGEKSPARRDADLVRQKLERATATTITGRSELLVDDQPFVRSWSAVSLRSFPITRLELGASVEAGFVRAPERLDAGGVSGTGRLRLGDADLDLAVWAGARFWSDEARTARGGAWLGLFPSGKVQVDLGAAREDELSTFAAVAEHVQRDDVYAELAWSSLLRTSGALRGDVYRYTDQNSGFSVAAWALAALVESPVELELGYAGAYRDTASSRWDPVTSSYLPYFTPLEARRHGPVLAVAVAAGAVRAHASAHYALFADERDPSTYGYYYSRREARHLDVRGGLRVSPGELEFAAGYAYLLETYYAAHVFSLEVDVPL